MVNAPEKRCRICGNDCSGTERVKNAQGQYACRECWREEQATLAARRRADSAVAGPAHVDPAHIDPALAETKLDEDPPSDSLLGQTPPDALLSPAVDPERDPLDLAREPAEIDGPIEVAEGSSQIPRDRSARVRGVRSSHLLILTACAVLTLIAAAGIHASVVDESNRIPAAGNGLISGLLQIGCAWIIFGLGTLIWIERVRAWAWCLAMLAVGAGVVNLVGLGAMYVPYAGWAITLGACALVARYALDLPWAQAGYLALAMFITTTGVRVAMSPRELDHAAEWVRPEAPPHAPQSPGAGAGAGPGASTPGTP